MLNVHKDKASTEYKLLPPRRRKKGRSTAYFAIAIVLFLLAGFSYYSGNKQVAQGIAGLGLVALLIGAVS